MAIKLLDLPYPPDALAPAISSATFARHHGNHYWGYVDKTNAALADTPLADARLEQIVAAAEENGDQELFNNAAQAWNHGFYWHSLTPEPGACPDGLDRAIDTAFGSRDALVAELVKRGTAHFASGWVWLVADAGGRLTIEETHDAGTLAVGDKRPLLTLDVWEHAYYLDYQNQRPAHLEMVAGNVLNWAFAADNFTRSEPWRYPT